MKKDIEWLRSKVVDYFTIEGNGFDVEGYEILDLINQLDEPEVLSQEWIDDNKEMYLINDTSENAVPDYKLRNLLVPKQESPVIPKYVDEWIIGHRDIFDLYPALKDLENNTLDWKLTYKWYRTNTHKFVNAYLTGEYEVEEEPMYYALIKGHELVDSYDIYWNCDKSDCGVFVSRLHPPHDNFLTEMTKEDWDKLGINDSNADFVRGNDSGQ